MLYLELLCDECEKSRFINCDQIVEIEEHEQGCLLHLVNGEIAPLSMKAEEFLGTMAEARETGMTAIRPEVVEIIPDVEIEGMTKN